MFSRKPTKYVFLRLLKSNKIFAEGTIDFKKMNLDKFIKDNIAFKDYVDKKGRTTLSGIKKMYLSNGAICQ